VAQGASGVSCANFAMASGVIYPVLGTMTIGSKGQVLPDVAAKMLEDLCKASCAVSPHGVMVDTALVYQNGDTEAVLGGIISKNPEMSSKLHIATKANPTVAPHKSLSQESVIAQCNISLNKLGVACIDLYYLHHPDVYTDLDDTLTGIDALHKQGKIKEFGLSNYPAWAVADIWHRCKSRGIVLPTVYQGMYNAITRDMEREIVPVARQFGIRLIMYNPLAGGLLSGRYHGMDDVIAATEGRFSPEFGNSLQYRARFSNAANFEALISLRRACDVADISMPNAALRWLLHHSLLEGGDSVIIGVSKLPHLAANLAAWQAGPLPAAVVEACDVAWAEARPMCEPYFRGYGKSPGGIEKFLDIVPRKRARL
jgi:aflatoxin B1 aldehyde reductase